jgi:hypothetical protein
MGSRSASETSTPSRQRERSDSGIQNLDSLKLLEKMEDLQIELDISPTIEINEEIKEPILSPKKSEVV